MTKDGDSQKELFELIDVLFESNICKSCGNRGVQAFSFELSSISYCWCNCVTKTLEWFKHLQLQKGIDKKDIELILHKSPEDYIHDTTNKNGSARRMA